MRLVPSRGQVNRDVSYEFMNRQMVWHAFTVSDELASPHQLIELILSTCQLSGILAVFAPASSHPLSSPACP